MTGKSSILFTIVAFALISAGFATTGRLGIVVQNAPTTDTSVRWLDQQPSYERDQNDELALHYHIEFGHSGSAYSFELIDFGSLEKSMKNALAADMTIGTLGKTPLSERVLNNRARHYFMEFSPSGKAYESQATSHSALMNSNSLHKHCELWIAPSSSNQVSSWHYRGGNCWSL